MKFFCGIAAIALSATPAPAEVSDDLKFCGGLKSGAERLACYDAAARIASQTVNRPNHRAARVSAAPMDAQAAYPTRPPTLPSHNAFDGYYVAAGSGYGTGTGRQASVTGHYTGFFGASLPMAPTEGVSAHFATGKNITFGLGFMGLELAGRYGGEEGGGSQAGGGPFFGDAFFGSSQLAYRYRNDAGVHAAIRAGVVFDDIMVFAKVGVGVSHIAETFTADERGISLFICPNRGPYNSCYLPGVPTPALNSVHASSWLPTAIFGIGVEKNWGPFFGRLGADFETINHQTTSVRTDMVSGYSDTFNRNGHLTWTARGTAMVGVRF